MHPKAENPTLNKPIAIGKVLSPKVQFQAKSADQKHVDTSINLSALPSVLLSCVFDFSSSANNPVFLRFITEFDISSTQLTKNP